MISHQSRAALRVATSSRVARLCLLTSLVLCTSRIAGAQSEVPSPSPVSAQPDDAAKRAQAHYQRAVEFFDKGELAAALVEFEAANKEAPTFRLQYNIAIAQARLKNPAAALTAFERYLSEGKADVPAERVYAVKAEMERLAPQVVKLRVETDQVGTLISLDDEVIGTAPLPAAINVNPGRHVVTCSSPSGTQTRNFEARAGESLELQCDTVKPAAKKLQLDPDALPPPKAEKQGSSLVWLPWAITGAFAAAATTTGILTLQARSSEESLQDQSRASRQEYEDARSKVERLALMTDILVGLTAASGATALYITLKSSKAERATSATLQIRPVPAGLSLRGQF